nr:glycosyltransferase [Bacteroides oleiciplenus]
MKEYTYKVLCIARLSSQKKVDLFLKVATLLPQYAFIWIGNQHAYTEEHPSNVFFMGSLPDAGAYNEYADVFMLPSNYEGLPMTIIETMSLAKPVVASNVGGISEIVVNGENGYTVENTPEEFVEKLQYILEKPGVCSEFSQKALAFYKKTLTMNKMVDSYILIYNSIFGIKR